MQKLLVQVNFMKMKILHIIMQYIIFALNNNLVAVLLLLCFSLFSIQAFSLWVPSVRTAQPGNKSMALLSRCLSLLKAFPTRNRRRQGNMMPHQLPKSVVQVIQQYDGIVPSICYMMLVMFLMFYLVQYVQYTDINRKYSTYHKYYAKLCWCAENL